MVSNKIYTEEQAAKIIAKKKGIEECRKNKTAKCRKRAEDLRAIIEIERLLSHDDCLYFEEVWKDL